MLLGCLEPRQREAARVGGVVARPRGTITSVRDLVALRGRVQTRLAGLDAPVGGFVALAGCAIADGLAGVVLFAVTAGL